MLFRQPLQTTTMKTVMTVMMMMILMMTMTESVGAVSLRSAERHERSKRSEAEEGKWSIWFNSDEPSEGEGDFETTDSITKTRRICSWDREIGGAQCRVAGTNDTFESSTSALAPDRLLQACSRHGLICLNAQQTAGLRCHDYEVRFLCQAQRDNDVSDSLFPNLNFQIYILLAAVPLLIIILRILWTCWWKPRVKRRRLLRQQQQQQQQQQEGHRGSTASGTLSSSSSQASFDSTLANPPPAYAELFGDCRPAVFAISGGECAGCAKCLHQPGVGGCGGVGGGVGGVGVGGVGGEGGRRGSGVVGEGVVIAASASRRRLSQDVPPSENDEVFGAGPPPPPPPPPAPPAAAEGTATVARPVAALLPRHSLASLQEAVASAFPPHLAPASPAASVQCTCACHRMSPSAHVNLAFRWDSSTQVDSSAPALYPGMHKPVFAFSRIGSVTSFTSLPDYEEALEILKKNGLFLEDEKV